MSDLRARMLNHLEGIMVTTMRDGEPSGLMPECAERIVDRLLSVLDE